MDKNQNNIMVFKPKRPKIKSIEDTNNTENYYQPLISENITLESIKNITHNRNISNNENKKKEENIRKKYFDINKKVKRKLTPKQKQLKYVINRISSPSRKVKVIFAQWVSLAFNHKKNLSSALFTNSEEEEEEGQEDGEEEEEDEEKRKLMNDLNINSLEEIEERPPNEEESALTSIMTKSGKSKNSISVALRKIIKYKNIFYAYFYHWLKVINNPKLLMVIRYQTILKNLIIKLEEKRNLLLLSREFYVWKMKSEQLKSNDKKLKKKKKIIIYKKKNGEIEIKDKNSNKFINVNKSGDGNLNLTTNEEKVKKVKIKSIKKNVNSLLKKSINVDDNNNNNDIDKSTIIQNKQVYLSQSNSIKIPINKIEKTEKNLNKNEPEENPTKSKRIIKKVKKIIKKVKADKEKENGKNNENEKEYCKTSEVLPDLSVSSGHFKLIKSLTINDNNINENDKLNISSTSLKKAIMKKKIKKLNKKIVNKSFDMLIPKDKKINMNNSFSQSNKPNIENIIDKIDDIFKDKDNSINNEENKKTKKKKIKNVKASENKSKIENNKIPINRREPNTNNLGKNSPEWKDEIREQKKKLSYKNNSKKKELKFLSPSKSHKSKITKSDLLEFSVEEDKLKNKETNNNIKMTQINDNDEEETKEKSIKSLDNDHKLLTKEEKIKYKIYNKAFVILKKVIKSFKKRNKINIEKLYTYFNILKNKLKMYDKKTGKMDNNIIINNNIEDNNNKKLRKCSQPNSKRKDILETKLNVNNINKNSYELEKNKLLNKIVSLVECAYKTKNDIINIISRADEKAFNNIDLENYIKVLEINNKKIYAYKIFCLYVNYNENDNFCMKYNNPKKYYFNYWNKICKKI